MVLTGLRRMPLEDYRRILLNPDEISTTANRAKVNYRSQHSFEYNTGKGPNDFKDSSSETES